MTDTEDLRGTHRGKRVLKLASEWDLSGIFMGNGAFDTFDGIMEFQWDFTGILMAFMTLQV